MVVLVVLEYACFLVTPVHGDVACFRSYHDADVKKILVFHVVLKASALIVFCKSVVMGVLTITITTACLNEQQR